MRKFVFFLFIMVTIEGYAQNDNVGIGTTTPNQDAKLDISATNKGLLLPRIALTGTANAAPLSAHVAGMIIYNTVTVGDVAPGCYYNNGVKWVSIPDETLTSIALNADNVHIDYVDEDGNTTQLDLTNLVRNLETLTTIVDNSDGTYTYINEAGASQVIDPLAAVIANNGLNKTGNTIQLGGDLTKPTEIVTSNVNTIAIKGLEDNTLANSDIVITDETTGVLSKTKASNLFQEFIANHIAVNGQTQFTTPMPITDINKINVYRNGVRLNFSMVNANTIELETGVVCYQNDYIKIVQFN
jgi:hypothetical protein